MSQTQPPAESVPQSPSLSACSEPSGVRGTILVVEDEAFVRNATCEILECEGYRVLRARNALEAKLAFDRNLGVVALLLTDVVLPGQNGRALARELRTTCPALRTILTSGYPSNLAAGSALGRGGIFYLPKPFSAQSLLQKVDQVLRKTDPQGRPRHACDNEWPA